MKSNNLKFLFFILSFSAFTFVLNAQNAGDCGEIIHPFQGLPDPTSDCGVLPENPSFDDMLNNSNHLNHSDTIIPGLTVGEIHNDLDNPGQDTVNQTPFNSENAVAFINMINEELPYGIAGSLLTCMPLSCYTDIFIDSLLSNMDTFYNAIIEEDPPEFNLTQEELEDYIENMNLDSLILDFFLGCGDTLGYNINNQLIIVDCSSPPCPKGKGFRSSNNYEGEIDLFSEKSLGIEGLSAPNPEPSINISGGGLSVEVNEFNGLPEASISISEFLNGDISVPISINYVSGSGVLIDQYGDELGQSWSLNAGGSISRSVKGLPDEFMGELNGSGYGKVQVFKPCIKLGGLGYHPVKPKTVVWDMNRPNEIAINIVILPTLWGSFYITFVAKIEVITRPGKVNYAETNVGYFYTEDVTSVSWHDLESFPLDFNDFNGLNNKDKSTYLLSSNRNQKIDDDRFLVPHLDTYLKWWDGLEIPQ